MSKLSPARVRANQKWDAENLEALGLKLPKGTKARWAGYAEKAGTSITKLIQQAMEELAERDGLK